MVQGVNSLVGSVDGYIPPGASGRATVFDDSPAVPSAGLFSGNGTDGTELYTGAIVLAALAILILFRLGGFQAIIAS
jgi:hypothetical protein